jgi:hypothetical protein
MTVAPRETAFNDWAIRCECGYDRRGLGLKAPCPECGAVPRPAPIDADIVIDGRRPSDRSPMRRTRNITAVATAVVVFAILSGCMSGLVGPIAAITSIILLAFASAVFVSFLVFEPTVAWVVERDGIASYVSARREAHVPAASIARATFRANAPTSGHLTLELLTRDGATWRLAVGQGADPQRAMAVERMRTFLLQRGVDVVVA